jgi:hypothetical protein
MHQLDELVGSWESETSDPVTKRTVGKVRMEFYSGGILAYIVFESDKMRIIKLTYRVVNDTIITDQPSRPRAEVTRFNLSDQSLELFYNSNWVRFKKIGLRDII